MAPLYFDANASCPTCPEADAAMRQVHVLKKRVAELEQMGIAL